MTPFLAPLKESIWLRVTILALACGFISVGTWVLATEYLPVTEVYAALTAGAVTLAIAVLIGQTVATYATSATDFLAKAILLVTHDDRQLEAPDEKNLKASKQFLIELAQSVYDLTAKTASTSDSLYELPFYRSIVNKMPIPVMVLDNSQKVTFANEAALRYINLPANEVINNPVYDAMNLSFVSEMTLESWLNDSTQNTVANSEVWERVRLTLPDETRKQFDMAVHYSKDDPNNIETIIVIFDRTRLYERDDHDLTFVSLAVHELRTPLTIMRGYIEVFEDELSPNLNGEQTAFMHNMGASAQQLTSFVSNILNVARVEENALYLKLKEEKWDQVLTAAAHDMDLRAKVHNKKLVVNIDPNLPTVAVDKVSIYEVINNLVDNAIKYTHTDEEIVIHSYLKDNMIETTVTDKGVGIPSSLIAHVFDKFYRAHQSKNSVGGTGLGLYLCRAIIDAHGGNIWVNSKEGEGSSFGFTLPIYANVADQINKDDSEGIVRGAHGWIKNHSIYRG